MTINPAKTSVMNPLEERIIYKFRNALLLAEALTHPSISLERKNYPFDNQRLEFLGDAVIQVTVTEHLFRMFPDFGEGQLTKLRTRIVSRPALRDRALALDLGSFIMMGRGEEGSGGRERASLWLMRLNHSSVRFTWMADLMPPVFSYCVKWSRSSPKLQISPMKSTPRAICRRFFKP